MPPTSRIAPIIKAARNATVPSIRSRYGRVVGRGMRQNAYAGLYQPRFRSIVICTAGFEFLIGGDLQSRLSIRRCAGELCKSRR
jgi:hypothetical protein